MLKKINYDYLNPMLFFSAYIFIFFILFIFLNQDYYISIETIIYFLFILISFNLGSLFFKVIFNKKSKIKNKEVKSIRIERKLKKISIIFFLISILYLLNVFKIVDIKISDIISIKSFIKFSSESAFNRYMGDYKFSKYFLILQAFVYAGLLNTGLVLSYFKDNNKKIKFQIIILSPCLALIISNVLLSAKLGIIYAVIFPIISYISFNKYFYNSSSLKIKKIIIIIIILIIILMVVQYFRYNGSLNINAIFKRKFGLYLIGGISAFSEWLNYDYLFSENFQIGVKTFTGFFSLIGLTLKKEGVYELIIINKMGIETNVFTTYRGLIEDFGIFGSYIIMFIFGMGMESLYQKNLRKEIIYVPILLLGYLWIIFSFVISIFIYTVNIISFILFFAEIIFVFKIKLSNMDLKLASE